MINFNELMQAEFARRLICFSSVEDILDTLRAECWLIKQLVNVYNNGQSLNDAKRLLPSMDNSIVEKCWITIVLPDAE